MNFASFLAFGKNSEWIEAEQMKPYWHEAAHAVVARLTGFPVKWVSTEDAFLQSAVTADYSHCGGASAVCMTISSPFINPILEKRSALNKQDKEVLIKYSMHVFAGPFFEQRFAPHHWFPEPSMNDYGQIEQVLKFSGLNKTGRMKLKRIALRRLENLQQQDLDAIARVAFALYPAKTIQADELDSIIGLQTHQMAA